MPRSRPLWAGIRLAPARSCSERPAYWRRWPRRPGGVLAPFARRPQAIERTGPRPVRTPWRRLLPSISFHQPRCKPESKVTGSKMKGVQPQQPRPEVELTRQLLAGDAEAFDSFVDL